jgi:hypothetical protein
LVFYVDTDLPAADAGFAIRRRHADPDDATRESWVVTVR